MVFRHADHAATTRRRASAVRRGRLQDGGASHDRPGATTTVNLVAEGYCPGHHEPRSSALSRTRLGRCTTFFFYPEAQLRRLVSSRRAQETMSALLAAIDPRVVERSTGLQRRRAARDSAAAIWALRASAC